MKLGRYRTIPPKTPAGPAWTEVVPADIQLENFESGRCVGVSRWQHVLGITVLSDIALVETDEGLVAQYHVSFSMHGDRAPQWVDRKVRTEFGMGAAEEDNHVQGGRVRNLWLYVAPELQHVCECRDEPETREIIPGAGEEGGEYVVREVPTK